jgi:uncharacterized protein with ParB-like and HNH nuclease domain
MENSVVNDELSTQVWFEDYADEEEEFQVTEYDITATPNDFNVSTLFNFIESGAVVIPGFQRHFVWDIKRASKLIESLILGLPVPQLFLYEEARNRFLVIDGQQRLMSIYYFIKQRFPRNEARIELRRIFEEHGKMPDEVLHDDKYFMNFRLQLPAKLPDQPNQFSGLAYATLGELKFQLDLRPIRNVIVKQNAPKDDDSSIYEIFSRLNSGGVNLAPQEIRLSLYHSFFYDMLMRINTEGEWRRILGSSVQDLHMKDVEILLRIFAMLVDGENYTPSMMRFLNQFSKKCRTHTIQQNDYLERLFKSFLEATADLPDDVFLNKRNRRFNIALIEAVFTAVCETPFRERRMLDGKLLLQRIQTLEKDPAFIAATTQATTQTTNVRLRLERGKNLIGSL